MVCYFRVPIIIETERERKRDTDASLFNISILRFEVVGDGFANSAKRAQRRCIKDIRTVVEMKTK